LQEKGLKENRQAIDELQERVFAHEYRPAEGNMQSIDEQSEGSEGPLGHLKSQTSGETPLDVARSFKVTDRSLLLNSQGMTRSGFAKPSGESTHALKQEMLRMKRDHQSLKD